jgi:hypothetical protein
MARVAMTTRRMVGEGEERSIPIERNKQTQEERDELRV